MIQINKSEPPRVLSQNGAERCKEDCRAFDENSEDYQNGVKRFQFNRNTYSHDTVRTSLQQAQQGKCCYCEEKFLSTSYGDIEHYRPKGAVRQDEDEPLLYPGYYWLAYSWKNLYFCCPKCNRSNKKELFPLKDPRQRSRSHNEDIAAERPLIIDPGGPENPREHIKYDKHLAYGETEIGKKTIEIVGLNRDDLWDERKERLEYLKHLQYILQLPDDKPELHSIKEYACKELENATKPTARFSAMAIDNLEG